jgi:hypothetical protein
MADLSMVFGALILALWIVPVILIIFGKWK